MGKIGASAPGCATVAHPPTATGHFRGAVTSTRSGAQPLRTPDRGVPSRMVGRQVSPGFCAVLGHMPRKSVKNWGIAACGKPIPVILYRRKTAWAGSTAREASRSARFHKRGLVAAFRDVEFRDGNLGLFWLKSQPRCGPIGRASENERFFGQTPWPRRTDRRALGPPVGLSSWHAASGELALYLTTGVCRGYDRTR